MDTVINFVNEWYQVILAIVGAFALIATKTPNEADNKIADLLLKLVNLFGANFGKAKNDPQRVGTGGGNPPKDPPGGG